MENTTIGDVLGFADKVTSIGLLLVFVIGFVRGWWVPGWVFKAKEKESDDWRDISLTAIPTLKELVIKK